MRIIISVWIALCFLALRLLVACQPPLSQPIVPLTPTLARVLPSPTPRPSLTSRPTATATATATATPNVAQVAAEVEALVAAGLAGIHLGCASTLQSGVAAAYAP